MEPLIRGCCLGRVHTTSSGSQRKWLAEDVVRSVSRQWGRVARVQLRVLRDARRHVVQLALRQRRQRGFQLLLIVT